MPKPINLALPQDVIEGLARLAAIEERSRSETARKLLREGLAAGVALLDQSRQAEAAEATVA